MPIEITLPAIAANVETAMIARWLVEQGQSVARGEPIAEIESEKATMEVEAPQDGVLAQVLVASGERQVKVGEVIALLTTDGEEPIAFVRAAQPATQTEASERRRIKASPMARRLARERRIDLSSLQGSGPGGRIVKSDVERVEVRGHEPLAPSASTAGAEVRPSIVSGPTNPATDAPYEPVRLSAMRRTIARRLTESKTTVPHFYLGVEVRLDALLKLRGELNEYCVLRLTLTDLLVKALGLALLRVPDANVQFAGEELRRFTRADIAVAVSVPGGLVTPVVRDAGSRPVQAIASEMKALTASARDGNLDPQLCEGGTASLSNLGMYGVTQFDAVINPPQALILALGAAERRPVVEGDLVQPATLMTVTGSFDHRAVDGVVAAQLMGAFRQLVEQPLRILSP